LVGLTTGVSPNIDFKNSGIELGKGIKVNQFLKRVQKYYAIGDCAEQREAIGLRRPIEAVCILAHDGRSVSTNINGKPTHISLGTGSIQQNF
jgi:NAD(P)H-nitrite reductase large subunit